MKIRIEGRELQTGWKHKNLTSIANKKYWYLEKISTELFEWGQSLEQATVELFEWSDSIMLTYPKCHGYNHPVLLEDHFNVPCCFIFLCLACTLGVVLNYICINKHYRWFWFLLTWENHWRRLLFTAFGINPGCTLEPWGSFLSSRWKNTTKPI